MHFRTNTLIFLNILIQNYNKMHCYTIFNWYPENDIRQKFIMHGTVRDVYYHLHSKFPVITTIDVDILIIDSCKMGFVTQINPYDNTEETKFVIEPFNNICYP